MKDELSKRAELGEAWNKDEVVWNGIEVGISASGEIVSGNMAKKEVPSSRAVGPVREAGKMI